MKLLYGIADELMHHIRIKLYPNYLPGYENTYIARADSDRTLDIEHIVASKIDRAGYKGDYNLMIENVKAFFDEAMYQLVNGNAINTGYFSAHPHVGGVFRSTHEQPNSKDHPLNIVFHAKGPLRKLAEAAEILNEGVVDAEGWIDSFTDTDEQSVNDVYHAGNGFIITGHKIKLAGSHPDVGLYIEGDDGSNPIKVARIIDNTANKISGIMPDPTPQRPWNRLRIVTQYAGSSVLKEPRTIISNFAIREV